MVRQTRAAKAARDSRIRSEVLKGDQTPQSDAPLNTVASTFSVVSHTLSQTRIEQPVVLESVDISSLRARMFKAKTKIKSLKEQMVRATKAYEARISELRSLEDAKIGEVAWIENLISPIRRVPVEILSKIMEFSCLPDDGIFNADHDTIRITWRLSSVCVAWRVVAYDTPIIWSNLCLSTKSLPSAFLREAGWVKVWLSRGRNFPLGLYLHFHEVDPCVEDALQVYKASRLLFNIMEFCQCIQSLDLSGSFEAFMPLLNLPQSSFPRLERLSFELSTLEIGTDEVHAYRSDVFLGSPKLQYVQTRRPNAFSLSMLLLPTEQLTTLEINEERFDPVYLVITARQCRHLVNLTICLEDPGPIIAQRHPIFLPVLISLDLSCHWRSTNRDLGNLIPCFTAPLLQNLTIQAKGGTRFLVKNAIEFQRRSETKLMSLTLVGFEASDGLVPMLNAFPTITSFRILHFGSVFDVEDILESMRLIEDRAPVLPKLTQLELLTWSRVMSLQYLARLVFERCPGVLDESSDKKDIIHNTNGLPEWDLPGATVARLQKVTLCGITLQEEERSMDVSRIYETPGLVVDVKV